MFQFDLEVEYNNFENTLIAIISQKKYIFFERSVHFISVTQLVRRI